jgi:hypothetical protein
VAGVAGRPAHPEDEQPAAPLAHRGEPVRGRLDRVTIDLVEDLRRLGEEVVGEGHGRGS